MITKHTIYVLTCDKCGRTYSQHEDDGYMTWFYSQKELQNDAKLENWVKDGKRFYCPDCWADIHKDEEYKIIKWKKRVIRSCVNWRADNADN